MDGTMCRGDGCLGKMLCYRFTAYVNPYRQSYFAVVPLQVDDSEGKCDEYVPNEEADKLARQEGRKKRIGAVEAAS